MEGRQELAVFEIGDNEALRKKERLGTRRWHWEEKRAINESYSYLVLSNPKSKIANLKSVVFVTVQKFLLFGFIRNQKSKIENQKFI
jgi:hypothetical protein